MSKKQHVTTLTNASVRLIAFGGLRNRADKRNESARMIPGEKKKIDSQEFEILRRDPIIRALIKAGDILDSEDAFDLDEDPNDLDALPSPPPPPRAGRPARLSTHAMTKNARADRFVLDDDARDSMPDPHDDRASSPNVTVPPVPAHNGAPSVSVNTVPEGHPQDGFASSPHDTTPPPAPLPASIAALDVEDAKKQIAANGDLELLKAWFKLDTRKEIREAINARGAEIVKKS